MSECMHDSHFPQGPDGEKKTGPCITHERCPEYERSREFDVMKVPEKSSAWSEADREIPPAEPSQPSQPSQDDLPPWLNAFQIGTTFTVNGWKCGVLHVAEGEPGIWAVLMMPLEPDGNPSRGEERAVYRQLVREEGKKQARAKIRQMRVVKQRAPGDCKPCKAKAVTGILPQDLDPEIAADPIDPIHLEKD